MLNLYIQSTYLCTYTVSICGMYLFIHIHICTHMYILRFPNTWTMNLTEDQYSGLLYRAPLQHVTRKPFRCNYPAPAMKWFLGVLWSDKVICLYVYVCITYVCVCIYTQSPNRKYIGGSKYGLRTSESSRKGSMVKQQALLCMNAKCWRLAWCSDF